MHFHNSFGGGGWCQQGVADMGHLFLTQHLCLVPHQLPRHDIINQGQRDDLNLNQSEARSYS